MDIRSRAVCVSALMTSALPVVTPQTTVGTALRLLRELRLPALPVCAGDRFVGLVGEKDLLRVTPSDTTTLDVYEPRGPGQAHGRPRRPRRASAPQPGDARGGRGSAHALDGHRGPPVMTGGRLAGLPHWIAVLGSALERPS